MTSDLNYDIACTNDMCRAQKPNIKIATTIENHVMLRLKRFCWLCEPELNETIILITNDLTATCISLLYYIFLTFMS